VALNLWRLQRDLSWLSHRAAAWLRIESETYKVDVAQQRILLGHLRLRTLPRTHRWKEVVRLMESEGSLQDVAQASFDAAQVGLRHIP